MFIDTVVKPRRFLVSASIHIVTYGQRLIILWFRTARRENSTEGIQITGKTTKRCAGYVLWGTYGIGHRSFDTDCSLF